MLPPAFARLGLDHLVDVVIWWDAHRSEAGRRNPLGKGDNKDIAGVQPRSEQRADEVGIMEETELKVGFGVPHRLMEGGIGDYCVVRQNYS